MKANNLIYISDIANFYLFGISRNIQRKPTVNIGNYSCIAFLRPPHYNQSVVHHSHLSQVL